MKARGIRPEQTFSKAAIGAVSNAQMRRNMRHATSTIRDKRLRVVREVPEWEELRSEAAAIKDHTLENLEHYLLQLEDAVSHAGGQVHWARDATEACDIVAKIANKHQATEVIKVKSILTDEIDLNRELELKGIRAVETDLAELIVQLGDDKSSHILVPAIHKNRSEIRDLFRKMLGADLPTDEPKALAEVARMYLRQKFMTTKVAVSGANFGVAETGTICVVESEGNGRMCLTMPQVLITLMGIEKLVPTFKDLDVFLRLLPRSSTAERMNPYTSFWTGVHDGDGPGEFHLVLLDNGRTEILADRVGRQTLRCIRCSACLNVCPVYERTGGHAYGSVYPGPIGAILTPQLLGMHNENANSLPFASSLCGACYDVCPVKINIPGVLIYLRNRIVREKPRGFEAIAFRVLAWIMSDSHRFERAIQIGRVFQRFLAKGGKIGSLPGPLAGWTLARDMRPLPKLSFREWAKGEGISS